MTFAHGATERRIGASWRPHGAGLAALVMIPLHFTAPADRIGPGRNGGMQISTAAVSAYLFERTRADGHTMPVTGFADSAGTIVLVPHRPGTAETVWLRPDSSGDESIVFVRSRDGAGNVSDPSNGCIVAGAPVPAAFAMVSAGGTRLDVPLVQQSREKCGEAALAMVLRYYGAGPDALREVAAAYDPVLRGSLITDLASAARRAGYAAEIATLTSDSLIVLLESGVPPILLYQNGTPPLTVRHFGVVTGWDAGHQSFTLNDGTARARVAGLDDFVKRWRTAGSQALIIRRRTP